MSKIIRAFLLQVKNLVTCQLIDRLKSQGHKVFLPEESVLSDFTNFFTQGGRNIQEPTVQTLLKIASDLDRERGFGSEDLAVPISAADVLTAIFEFNESLEVMLDEKAVLVTGCHGAKGLEFKKVIQLADDFKTTLDEIESERRLFYVANFKTTLDKIESERRLFYVAMTRAKEELVLCSTGNSLFVTETGIVPKSLNIATTSLPQKMYYADLSLADVHLGHYYTKKNQQAIASLTEGSPLKLKANKYNDGWEICTIQGQIIGGFSRKENGELCDRGFKPGQFQFQPQEVTVRSIYRHLKMDDITGVITEDWFVVVPQIRVCR